MIGVVIVTHSQLGDAFIEAAEFIIGSRPDTMVSVSIDLKENADKLREKIAKGIKTVNRHKGVLILTDMFGGTGVNLPILIQAINKREQMALGELAEHLETFGKKSISLASGILKGNKRK